MKNLINTCFEFCSLLYKRPNLLVFAFSIYRYPNAKAGMFVFWLDYCVFSFSCIQHCFVHWNICVVQVKNRTQYQSITGVIK